MKKWPVRDDEWHAAVDAAHALLHLESARQYGLVTGGPQVDVGRCEQILEGGRRRGILPSADAITRLVKELTSGSTI